MDPCNAPPGAAARTLRLPIAVRMRRPVLRAATLLVSCSFVVIAFPQGRPEPVASRLGLTLPLPGTAESRAGAGAPAIPGFQRRGNTLVGELTSRDGAIVRLVFDARTHALIGIRVLDAVESPAARGLAQAGCINQGAAAPLPGDGRPAN